MNDDFKRFLSARPVAPSSELSARVLGRIHSDLQPSTRGIYLAKIGLLHLASSALTLLACPQFGVGPLGGGHGVMSWVMPYGLWACALFCGAFFLGSTALLAGLVLRPVERRRLEHSAWPVFISLGVLSWALFMVRAWFFNDPQPFADALYVALWLSGGVLAARALLSFVPKRLHWGL